MLSMPKNSQLFFLNIYIMYMISRRISQTYNLLNLMPIEFRPKRVQRTKLGKIMEITNTHSHKYTLRRSIPFFIVVSWSNESECRIALKIELDRNQVDRIVEIESKSHWYVAFLSLHQQHDKNKCQHTNVCVPNEQRWKEPSWFDVTLGTD